MEKKFVFMLALIVSVFLLISCVKTGPNQYVIDPFKAIQDAEAKADAQRAREAALKAQKEAQKEIKTLSISMAEKIANSGKKTIAVVDFLDLQGNDTELGRYLAEEFSVDLAGANKGFEVIDRTSLKSILKEHELSLTGLINPETIKKFGKITGADAIVTGTTIPLGDIVRVTVKVLDTETARVIDASAEDIGNTQAIRNLLANKIATSSLGGQSPSSASGEMSNTIQRVESHGFTFELKKCWLSGGSIKCRFLITNNGADKRLKIYVNGGSRLFDSSGSEYHANGVQLGNHIGRYKVWDTLVSGIPTNAEL